jgi:arginyl-tRNA synthetase
MEIAGDLADEFMQGLLAKDPESWMLWNRIRDWVMEGHRRTLDRFGVRIDRHDFESEAMGDVPELIERGLRHGVLEREPDGTVVYRSGREEFETMILVRNDGFPTEHARLLGVYFRMLEERGPATHYIDLSGTEWQPASVLHMELMEKISPERPNERHILLFHGMVTLRNSKMSSSGGEAILIDDLLDQLAALPEIQAVAEIAQGAVDADTIADIVVKSFFLCRPHMKVMEFSWELLTQPDNPGWTIARAWAHAMAPEDETQPHVPELYRLAVLRSQDYHRNLESAATEFNLSGLTSYLVHFCDDYLRAPNSPRLQRVARAVIGRCLRSLGLLEG